jgi:hypothetical protein
VDSSWCGNEKEWVSCRKYNKIRMIVDIEDEFRKWGARKIVKYWYWIEEYVLERIEKILFETEFRVWLPQTILRVLTVRGVPLVWGYVACPTCMHRMWCCGSDGQRRHGRKKAGRHKWVEGRLTSSPAWGQAWMEKS